MDEYGKRIFKKACLPSITRICNLMLRVTEFEDATSHRLLCGEDADLKKWEGIM